MMLVQYRNASAPVVHARGFTTFSNSIGPFGRQAALVQTDHLQGFTENYKWCNLIVSQYQADARPEAGAMRQRLRV